MLKTVHTTLIELFRLLGFTVDQAKKEVSDLQEKIEQETFFEIREGMKESEREMIKTFKDAEKILGMDTCRNVLETACSRILVSYYAQRKKSYTENQKEVFLTFLITNKVRRELNK